MPYCCLELKRRVAARGPYPDELSELAEMIKQAQAVAEEEVRGHDITITCASVQRVGLLQTAPIAQFGTSLNHCCANIVMAGHGCHRVYTHLCRNDWRHLCVCQHVHGPYVHVYVCVCTQELSPTVPCNALFAAYRRLTYGVLHSPASCQKLKVREGATRRSLRIQASTPHPDPQSQALGLTTEQNHVLQWAVRNLPISCCGSSGIL